MEKLHSPLLALILDPSRIEVHKLPKLAEIASNEQVDLIILRSRNSPSGELFDLAKKLRSLISPPSRFLLNDRTDIAILAGADGVHLPEEGLRAEQVRELFKRTSHNKPIIGRSVHSLDRALRSAEEGVDYLIAGTMFPTPSKPGKKKFEGPELIAKISEKLSLPILGIGGITPENARQIITAGGSGVAVIGTIAQSPDPKKAIRNLRRALESSVQEKK